MISPSHVWFRLSERPNLAKNRPCYSFTVGPHKLELMAILHADRDDFPLLFFFKARLRSLRCIVLTTLSVLIVLRAAVQLFIQVLETSTLNSRAHESLENVCLWEFGQLGFALLRYYVAFCAYLWSHLFLTSASLTVDKWNLHSYYYQYKKNLTNNINR